MENVIFSVKKMEKKSQNKEKIMLIINAFFVNIVMLLLWKQKEHPSLIKAGLN